MTYYHVVREFYAPTGEYLSLYCVAETKTIEVTDLSFNRILVPQTTRETWCIAVADQRNFQNDSCIELQVFYPKSEEEWRRPIAYFGHYGFGSLTKSIDYLMRDFQICADYRQTEMDFWIADRVDHEVKEYRKFWNIK